MNSRPLYGRQHLLAPQAEAIGVSSLDPESPPKFVGKKKSTRHFIIKKDLFRKKEGLQLRTYRLGKPRAFSAEKGWSKCFIEGTGS